VENVQKKVKKIVDTPMHLWDSANTHGNNKLPNMRTKLLAAAAILAAGVASSMAQNVYSLNVVGYVNKAFVGGGFTAAANPLNGTNNSLNTIMKGTQVPDNTTVFFWDAATQDFSPILPTYNAGSQTWVPDATLNPGTGVFVFAPSAFTNTFVGEVKQGLTSIPIPASFSAIASPVPIGGDVSVVLAQLPAGDNDTAFKWGTTEQDFTELSSFNAGSGQWIPPVSFQPADGILYFRAGSATTWNRNYTVPATP
jgi:hypothetical protein